MIINYNKAKKYSDGETRTSTRSEVDEKTNTITFVYENYEKQYEIEIRKCHREDSTMQATIQETKFGEKRISSKLICFSLSREMLEDLLKILTKDVTG